METEKPQIFSPTEVDQGPMIQPCLRTKYFHAIIPISFTDTVPTNTLQVTLMCYAVG